MSIGEGLFVDVCNDPDPAAHIRSMSDDALAKLQEYLKGRAEQRGIIGEVWATVVCEGAKRFFNKGGAK